MRKDKEGYSVLARSYNTLKVGDSPVIKAYYIKGAGEDKETEHPTPKTFYRRAYWLIEQPRHILIHYLDTR